MLTRGHVAGRGAQIGRFAQFGLWGHRGVMLELLAQGVFKDAAWCHRMVDASDRMRVDVIKARRTFRCDAPRVAHHAVTVTSARTHARTQR